MKKIILDEKQKEAIKSVFENNITIITGSAGTGKSLICNYICEIAKRLNLTVRLMSPTGKAAQVLSEKTGRNARTIHRSLKLLPGAFLPGEEIKEDIVIIDEISMCGIDTIYPTFVAIENSPKTKLVFVGDKNQLPSVSPGNFLTDIMKSGCVKIIALDKIHRQDENSFISIVAKDISNGIVTSIPQEASDIKWHNIDSENFEKDLLKHIDSYLVKNSMNDLQIISPMKKGTCGVFSINRIIQEKMASVNNTKSSLFQTGYSKYYIGDRVIQMENNYEKDIFNGDIGYIVALGEGIIDPSVKDKKERFIKVRFENKDVYYEASNFEELSLAWCITVHKYQGSSSKNIIMIMASEAQVMMSKELIYTGMTRASKHLDIFGNIGMLNLAPTRSTVKKRYTNVQKLIKSFQENKKIFDILGEQNEKTKKSEQNEKE